MEKKYLISIGNKLDGKYINVDYDAPGEELYNKYGSKYEETYKKVSDQASEEVFDKYSNKLDGIYGKLESDLPCVDVYDKNKRK